MIELVLGGVKSGKTALAEQKLMQVESNFTTANYIATANKQYHDEEMLARVNRHRQLRPDHWLTIEEPLHLSAAIDTLSNGQHCILVDCLTLWVSNHLEKNSEQWPAIQDQLINSLSNFAGHIILVSNETSLGVTPMNALSRQFLDHCGRLHQAIAAIADTVTLSVAGCPLVIKEQSTSS